MTPQQSSRWPLALCAMLVVLPLFWFVGGLKQPILTIGVYTLTLAVAVAVIWLRLRASSRSTADERRQSRVQANTASGVVKRKPPRDWMGFLAGFLVLLVVLFAGGVAGVLAP